MLFLCKSKTSHLELSNLLQCLGGFARTLLMHVFLQRVGIIPTTPKQFFYFIKGVVSIVLHAAIFIWAFRPPPGSAWICGIHSFTWCSAYPLKSSWFPFFGNTFLTYNSVNQNPSFWPMSLFSNFCPIPFKYLSDILHLSMAIVSAVSSAPQT